LRNGEYSFPIILGLFGTPRISRTIRAAIRSSKLPVANRDKVLAEGVAALQASGVRDACLSELEGLKSALADFSFLWGRQEKMTVKISVAEVKVESA
jgi:geranylgeranyldiphosphate transferase